MFTFFYSYNIAYLTSCVNCDGIAKYLQTFLFMLSTVVSKALGEILDNKYCKATIEHFILPPIFTITPTKTEKSKA